MGPWGVIWVGVEAEGTEAKLFSALYNLVSFLGGCSAILVLEGFVYFIMKFFLFSLGDSA